MFLFFAQERENLRHSSSGCGLFLGETCVSDSSICNMVLLQLPGAVCCFVDSSGLGLELLNFCQ